MPKPISARPGALPTDRVRHAGGFTLVELMVVVVIVAILAAIALPSYSDYAKRGKIPDATSNLAAQRVKLEQYFQDSKTYTGAPTCIANDTTTSTNFTFACTVTLGGLGYTLSATGVGSMLGFVYTVDQTNARTTAAVPAGWTAPTPNNCWVTSKSGSC